MKVTFASNIFVTVDELYRNNTSHFRTNMFQLPPVLSDRDQHNKMQIHRKPDVCILLLSIYINQLDYTFWADDKSV